MTIEDMPNPGLEPVPTKTTAGRTMIGHVVVCQGRDENYQEAIAVWHVNTVGASVGAWIVPFDLTKPESTAAHAILRLCLQRAVIAWEPAEALSILSALEAAADVPRCPWSESTVALPDMLEDIRLTRFAYEKRAAIERQAKRNIVSIDWPVKLPETLPATAMEFQQLIRLVLPETNSAAHNTLLTSNLARWTLQRWQETANALKRRRYLQQEFGPPTQLPAIWETRLADAYVRNRWLSDARGDEHKTRTDNQNGSPTMSTPDYD